MANQPKFNYYDEYFRRGIEMNHNEDQKGWHIIYGVKYYGHPMKDSIPCEDPYLRNDFSNPPSCPPIEDHQPKPMTFEEEFAQCAEKYLTYQKELLDK